MLGVKMHDTRMGLTRCIHIKKESQVNVVQKNTLPVEFICRSKLVVEKKPRHSFACDSQLYVHGIRAFGYVEAKGSNLHCFDLDSNYNFMLEI